MNLLSPEISGKTLISRLLHGIVTPLSTLKYPVCSHFQITFVSWDPDAD